MICNKYKKSVFKKNIEVLLKYDWEPEIELTMQDGNKLFITVYKDFIDVFDDPVYCRRVKNINQLLVEIKWSQISKIKELNGVDFTLPIEKQSIIIDGILWLNGEQS